METLPTELIWEILDYFVFLIDIYELRLVCKLFNELVCYDNFWVNALVIESEQLDKKFGGALWKRTCFENRMICRYYRMMGCESDEFAHMRTDKLLDRFAYHLYFSEEVNNALIYARFPIPVRNWFNTRPAIAGYCIDDGCVYNYSDNKFVDACNEQEIYFGIDLYTVQGIKRALEVFVNNGFRLRIGEHKSYHRFPDKYTVGPKVKHTKKLFKFGFLHIYNSETIYE